MAKYVANARAEEEQNAAVPNDTEDTVETEETPGENSEDTDASSKDTDSEAESVTCANKRADIMYGL